MKRTRQRRFRYEPEGRKKKKKSKDYVPPGAEAQFGKGIRGRQASVAHAHVQDYAQLDVACSE